MGVSEFERLLKESQKEVLRLQRQLSVTSSRDQSIAPTERQDRDGRVRAKTERKHALSDAAQACLYYILYYLFLI